MKATHGGGEPSCAGACNRSFTPKETDPLLKRTKQIGPWRRKGRVRVRDEDSGDFGELHGESWTVGDVDSTDRLSRKLCSMESEMGDSRSCF